MEQIGTTVRRRWSVGGSLVELDTVVCRRRNLKRLLRENPHLASYTREHVPPTNLVLLFEDPFASGKFAMNPAYAAEARRGQAEWEALLSQDVTVTSEQGVG